jgi:D-sedoheptulose 7-phosphate isomerase
MTEQKPHPAIGAALEEAAEVLDRLRGDVKALEAIDQAGRLLADCLRTGGRAIACGNGGSMSDAMHFAAELSGRYRMDRPALAAMAISDPGHMTCAANDLGFEEVFARYVEAHGRRGDVLLAISTSGRSPNVVRAARRAREIGITVIALTGRPASDLAAASDVEICTSAGEWSDRIQELHIKVVHILVDLIERRLGMAVR